MPTRIENTDGLMKAYLEGELDHHTAREMREAIDEAAGLTRPQKLVLDFRDVTFMDSSGIGLVMGRYKLLTSWGGKVSIANTSPHITKVMKLAGMERLASIEPVEQSQPQYQK